MLTIKIKSTRDKKQGANISTVVRRRRRRRSQIEP